MRNTFEMRENHDEVCFALFLKKKSATMLPTIFCVKKMAIKQEWE